MPVVARGWQLLVSGAVREESERTEKRGKGAVGFQCEGRDVSVYRR